MRAGDPKISVASNLKLAYALFLTPLAFLFYVMVGDAISENDVARKEIVGSDFVVALQKIESRLASPGGALPANIAAEIENAQAHSGARRETAANVEQAEAAITQAKTTAEARAAVHTLIEAAADDAGLTLDPELGSFYVQNVMAMEVPELVDRFATLAETVAKDAGESELTATDQAEVLTQIGGVKAGIAALQKFVSSFGNEARSNAALPKLSSEVKEAIGTLNAATDNLDGMAIGSAQADPDDAARFLSPALASLAVLSDESAAALHELLLDRIGRTLREMWSNIAIAAVLFLAGVAFVLYRVELGAIAPLRRLTGNLKRLAEDDVNVVIEGTNRSDEIGELARAAYAFKESLAQNRDLETKLNRSRESLVHVQRIGLIGSADVDLRTGIARWSEGMLHIYGLDAAAIPKDYQAYLTLVHPDDVAFERANRERIERGWQAPPLEYRILRSDGEVRWIHIENEMRFDDQGTPVSLFTIHQDITDRRRMEEDMRRDLESLAAAQRIGKVGSVYIDLRVGAATWSDEMLRIYGIDRASQPQTLDDYLRLVHPQDHALVRETDRQSKSDIETRPIDYRILRPNGQMRWIRFESELRRDRNGKPITLYASHQDITEQENMKSLMAKIGGRVGDVIGEDFLKTLVASVASVLDIEIVRVGSFDFANRMTRGLYTYAHGRFVDNRDFSFENLPTATVITGQSVVMASGATDRYPRLKDISKSKIDAYAAYPLIGSDGKVLGLLSVMGERPWSEPDSIATTLALFAGRAAAELERVISQEVAENSRRKMAEVVAALDIARNAVILLDDDYRITYTNDVAFDVLGLPFEPEAMIGKRLSELQAADPQFLAVAAKSKASVETTGQWQGMVPWRRLRDGRALLLDHRAHRLPNGGFVLVSTDATERLRLEEEDRRHREREAQASKIEALGNLAGGIAHDFNNLLGAVLGFGQFLTQDLEAGTDQHKFAERIVAASERGRSLVRQILTFSRRTAIEATEVRPREIFAEAHEMLRATLPSTTQFVLENSLQDATVFMDKGQLLQVLVNLCVNASDALNEMPGTVTVSVSRPDIGRPDLRRLPAADGRPDLAAVETWSDPDGTGHILTGGMPRGDSICISVADTGSGIPQEMLGRILEPFVTTKERGKGTGLGLAVIHRIVLDHGGAMVVTTRKESGTRFDIVLPLASGEKHGPAVVQPAAAEEIRVTPEAAAKVLVVDDDEAYLAMVETALRRVGHQVQSTRDPRIALDWFKSDGAGWDVLVTDQTMPHIRGNDLVRQVKMLEPRTICILCTGFSSGLSEHQAVTAGSDAFLLKPYSVGDLANLISRLRERDRYAADRQGVPI